MARRQRPAAAHLGTYGERVGRERAARRRAAREKADARDETPRAADVPAGDPEVIEIPQSDLANELSVLAALIMAGLARSHPEARRLFRDQGITVNGVPVLADKAKLRPADTSPEGVIALALGDGRRVLLRPV